MRTDDTKDTTLTADVGPCRGEGIIIDADNIRLNLNGRRVLGNSDQGASGEFAGIRLAGRTGVTVTGHPGKSGKTGTVSGFEAGVVIDGGSANTVANLTARDNIGRDDRSTPTWRRDRHLRIHLNRLRPTSALGVITRHGQEESSSLRRHRRLQV